MNRQLKALYAITTVVAVVITVFVAVNVSAGEKDTDSHADTANRNLPASIEVGPASVYFSHYPANAREAVATSVTVAPAWARNTSTNADAASVRLPASVEVGSVSVYFSHYPANARQAVATSVTIAPYPAQ